MKARRLNDPSYSNKLVHGRESDWLYRLSDELLIELLGRKVRNCVIRSHGMIIASIRDNILSMVHGFAWNGMTCWGDSPKNIIPSAPHDLGYQIGDHPDNPLTRKEWDHVLLAMLQQNKDRTAHLCFGAVRSAGAFFYSNGAGISIEFTQPTQTP